LEPREHLDQIVHPNMADVRADFGDIRKAFNAVAAVDALAGHLYRWCAANAPNEVINAQNDSAYRHQLAQVNSDFALVRDIAKAQKHIHLIQGSPQVTTADQVEVKPLGWDEAGWGEGRWDSPPQVVVETNSGETRVVEAILENALAFLEAEMTRIGTP